MAIQRFDDARVTLVLTMNGLIWGIESNRVGTAVEWSTEKFVGDL